MSEYKQSGLNNKYPLEIVTWRITDLTSPEWLTDICRVSHIDDYGPHIETRTINSREGSYEIIGSDNVPMISVMSVKDYVCKDKNSSYARIFVLTEKQLNLLYKK